MGIQQSTTSVIITCAGYGMFLLGIWLSLIPLGGDPDWSDGIYIIVGSVMVLIALLMFFAIQAWQTFWPSPPNSGFYCICDIVSYHNVLTTGYAVTLEVASLVLLSRSTIKAWYCNTGIGMSATFIALEILFTCLKSIKMFRSFKGATPQPAAASPIELPQTIQAIPVVSQAKVFTRITDRTPLTYDVSFRSH